jgi:hypothetical protein
VDYGRTNFSEFRKLVEMQMSVGNLIKQGSNMFGDYFEKLSKEVAVSTDKVGYTGKISIVPTEEFVGGVGVSVHLTAGNDFEPILNSLPDYMTHSPVTYSLEIGIKDAEQGPMIVSRLNEIIAMFGEMIPPLQQALAMGLEVHFRSFGSSIFADITLGGVLGQQVQGGIGMFNLGQTNFAGNSNFHLTSGFVPMILLTHTLEDILTAATQLKIEGTGEYSSIKTLINSSTQMITMMNGGNIPQRLQPLILALKMAGSLKKTEFSLKYDTKALKECIIDGINLSRHHADGPTEFQRGAEKFLEQQGMFNMMVEQGKGMVMFVADYLDIIKNINLDSLSLHFLIPNVKLFYKLTVRLPGATNWLNDNILN